MTIYSLDVLLFLFGTSLLFHVQLTVASWPAYRFLKRQVRWSGISHLFQNFPQFIVIHTVKGFGIIIKAEIYVFLEHSFSMIQRMLAIWSLVPLPFLNPTWTSGSSRFTYCWSLWYMCYIAVLWIFLWLSCIKRSMFKYKYYYRKLLFSETICI